MQIKNPTSKRQAIRKSAAIPTIAPSWVPGTTTPLSERTLTYENLG